MLFPKPPSDLNYQARVALSRNSSRSSRASSGRGGVGFGEIEKGKTATSIEEYLFRLEKHGLLRILVKHNEDDYALAPEVGKGSVEESLVLEEDIRQPYFYLCNACSLALSPELQSAPSLSVLQDAHHHFASARHRLKATWSNDPKINETVGEEGDRIRHDHYARIFVNGIPFLLSRSPGGGDMFYPLPHETSLVNPEGTSGPNSVLPPSRDLIYWYNPISSLFTWCRQLVVPPSVNLLQSGLPMPCERSASHFASSVAHIPLSALPYRDVLPVYPILLPIYQTPVRRVILSDAASDETTTEKPSEWVHIQSSTPVYYESRAQLRSCSNSRRRMRRCLIRADSIYRAVLVKPGVFDELSLYNKRPRDLSDD
ncbi:hypothetical protein ADEAN_000299200 [Angomonas deanei]|uniref:Uncharacterized protein n=1 Tax=Angomonas deanei TaxID=59799 RepID=A0A7G2C9I8_9TRYP|nr:hypothetical protein ADEAN_000299200 [Angomonas deanei]